MSTSPPLVQLGAAPTLMPFASSSLRPRFLRKEADSDEESETSSSGGEDDLEEDFPEEAQVEEDPADEVAPGKRKKPPPITISLKRVCKVPYFVSFRLGFRYLLWFLSVQACSCLRSAGIRV